METERHCLSCGTVLDPIWARKNQKYCDTNCKGSYWYFRKYKVYYDSKYRKLKREWERSPTGKRAGVPIRQWIKLPKDWQ